MENAVKLFPKRKRECVTTKLTMSKKCKRYRKSQLIRNQEPLEQCLSMDCSDAETAKMSDGNSEEKCFLFPQHINPFNNYYFPLPKESKDKCTQCNVKTKNSQIQTCPNVRSKCIQTVSMGKLTSTSCTQMTQDNVDAVFENELLCLLQENNVLAKFAEILNNNCQTEKFVNCLKAIADGKFEITNLCWKAFLDIGTLLSQINNTNGI